MPAYRFELQVPPDVCPAPLGTLAWASGQGPRGAEMAFRYSDGWLRHGGFSLGTDLPLKPGVQFPLRRPWQLTARAFGFVEDHSPGIWTSRLFEKARLFGFKGFRREDRFSEAELWSLSVSRNSHFSALNLPVNEPVNDSVNISLGDRKKIRALLLALETLQLSPARLSSSDTELLLASSCALPGSRPKAVVDGEASFPGEWILRFYPGREDLSDIRWMAIAAGIARRCGLCVCESRPYGHDCLLERRFDRDEHGGLRLCLSAATLVRQGPKAPGYLDIADIICREGSNPAEDLVELWRRLLFNVLICNKRSRLRDFWFYRKEGGWKLAPMHAPCPGVPSFRVRLLPIPILGNDTVADPQTVLAAARYFGVGTSEAERTRLEFMRAVSCWRQDAAALAVHPAESSAMEGAFFS